MSCMGFSDCKYFQFRVFFEYNFKLNLIFQCWVKPGAMAPLAFAQSICLPLYNFAWCWFHYHLVTYVYCVFYVFLNVLVPSYKLCLHTSAYGNLVEDVAIQVAAIWQPSFSSCCLCAGMLHVHEVPASKLVREWNLGHSGRCMEEFCNLLVRCR